ncbi:MAG TPA: MFS transporter [Bacillota bacterium]|nr:MFS transporter [Bacillota bacterium]
MLVLGIVFVAFNLRPAITSVGPVIGSIRDDVGLSNWSAGILTSLPLIAFSFMSPLVPKLGHRYTNERALVLGLVLLTIGILVRSVTWAFLLFSGTLFAGMGIAILNVLLPSVIKDKFPTKVPFMTSVYSTAMGTFAAIASGLSVPIAFGLNLGWEAALLVWAIPSVMAIIIWFYLIWKDEKNETTQMAYVQSRGNRMWRSPLAWQVASFMGLQSFTFYVTISWLPEILHDYGVSLQTAGWMLSFTQFIGLPTSFFVPVIAGRFTTQRWIALVLCLTAFAGYGGLLIGTSNTTMVISIILIGLALGGIFPLALALLGMRARTARQAAELSGMAQAFGYLLAAVGPTLIGYLYDLAGNWEVPLITLMITTLLVASFGMGAGRNKYVLDDVGEKTGS